MVTKMTDKEVLIKAKELIDKNGLAHEAFERDGCYCTIGAIVKVIHPDAQMSSFDPASGTSTPCSEYVTTDPQVVSLGSVILKVVGSTSTEIGDVFDLNDRSTKQEVLAYFDKAIESLP